MKKATINYLLRLCYYIKALFQQGVDKMKRFEEVANFWLDHDCYGDNYSYRTEKKNAVSHLIQFFGGAECEKIKCMDVENFIKYETEHLNPNTGKPYSKKLITDHINIGNRIFEFALDNEIINCRNPFQRKRRRIPKNAPKKERKPINEEQKDLILRVYHRTQIAALIMLYCGLRRGEIIPLEWTDIDFINKQIAVTKSVERINGNTLALKAHTKNGKDRYVSIPDNLIPFLKLEKYNSEGKLIYPQKCGKLHTESSWKKTWNSYQTQLNYQYYCDTMKKMGRTPKAFNAPSGIPELMDRFTAHQLRHTYCTMLYLAGVDILTASKLMGHSDVKITLEIYTHLDEKYKRLNIDKFNKFIAGDTANQIMSIDKVV